MNNNKIIYIFTCKYGYYISLVIKYLLLKNNIDSVITESIDLRINNLYIILFSQKVKTFPKNYIIYQLEQCGISNWINNKYKLSILFSKKTFDYSHANINKFDTFLRKKISYFNIPCIKYSNLIQSYYVNNVINDVLFYGSINESRKNTLKYLKSNLKKNMENIKIKIQNNLFGQNLFNEILKSKIIINIHYYKNSILETCRLNEALSCSKLIISMYPNKEDDYNFNLYKDKVIFVKDNDEMIEKIIYYLKNKEEYIKQINKIKFYENYEEIINLLDI